MEASALLWSERLIALALILQTFEYLAIKSSMNSDGIWSWEILRDDFAIFPKPLRWVFETLLSYPNVVYLLAFQLCMASLLLLGFWFPFLAGLLFFSSALMSMRFRGVFNGGADYMTLIVLAALTVGETQPRLEIPALYYIAAQVCLSYFVSGFFKIKQKQWRTGEALKGFLQIANADIPPAAQALVRRGSWALYASWAVVVFELLFPLTLLNHTAALIGIGAGLIFHVMNAYVFGLNRFFWAWMAAYPALYYVSLAR